MKEIVQGKLIEWSSLRGNTQIAKVHFPFRITKSRLFLYKSCYTALIANSVCVTSMWSHNCHKVLVSQWPDKDDTCISSYYCYPNFYRQQYWFMRAILPSFNYFIYHNNNNDDKSQLNRLPFLRYHIKVWSPSPYIFLASSVCY